MTIFYTQMNFAEKQPEISKSHKEEFQDNWLRARMWGMESVSAGTGSQVECD